MLIAARAMWKQYAHGIFLVATIAAAAGFLSEHYGAPIMLFALLIGMAFHFLWQQDTCARGVDFAATNLLRLGVGLLGVRLTMGDIQSIGLVPGLAVAGFVLATLACGALMALLLGRRLAFGLLAGGSVAICGASAALAIASVLPPRPEKEQDTLFVIIAVTALSTVAMVTYPILFSALGLSHTESGFLVGATIHDVAQVVGAGYSISDGAGVLATFVKMLRVAMLPVVMILVMISFRGSQTKRPQLPWFLVMFVGLACFANLGMLHPIVIAGASDLSRWFLVIAISALGVKTSLGTFAKVKPAYAVIVFVETLFLLVIALFFVLWVGI